MAKLPNPKRWLDLTSRDPRKPVAKDIILSAAGVVRGRVTLMKITQDGSMVQGRVLTHTRQVHGHLEWEAAEGSSHLCEAGIFRVEFPGGDRNRPFHARYCCQARSQQTLQQETTYRETVLWAFSRDEAIDWLLDSKTAERVIWCDPLKVNG